MTLAVYPATQGETHERNSSVASLWAIFNISEEQSDKPMVLEYTIRSYDFDDSIFAIWNDEEPSREGHCGYWSFLSSLRLTIIYLSTNSSKDANI